jgi:hypothetical protein
VSDQSQLVELKFLFGAALWYSHQVVVDFLAAGESFLDAHTIDLVEVHLPVIEWLGVGMDLDDAVLARTAVEFSPRAVFLPFVSRYT